MNCFFDDNPARGVCRFCGRAICATHAEKRMPYIASVYIGNEGVPKAIAIADALWCGTCTPEPEPVPMPEIL